MALHLCCVHACMLASWPLPILSCKRLSGPFCLFPPSCRGPAELMSGLPLVQRSYLGVLLPESLLHMLESYGPGVFAAALSGDHNTPEIIWTAGMRQQRLIPAMLQVCNWGVHLLSGCSWWHVCCYLVGVWSGMLLPLLADCGVLSWHVSLTPFTVKTWCTACDSMTARL